MSYSQRKPPADVRGSLGFWVGVLMVIGVVLLTSTPLGALERMEGNDLWVEYEKKQQALAERVFSEGEETRRRVAGDLGLVVQGSIGIRLYSSSRAFRKAVGAEDRPLTVGIAYSHGDFIEMDASGLLESPREILVHEITHILLRQHLGESYNYLPLWLNEGLAQMETGPLPIGGVERLREAAGQGLLPNLAWLEEAFPEGREGTSLAYLQSQAATEFLRKRYGIEALRRLLALLREGKGFESSFRRGGALPPPAIREPAPEMDSGRAEGLPYGVFLQAFREAMGVGFDRFEEEWKQSLRQRWWEVLFRGGAPLGIWAVGALLVLYGFLRLRRRGKALLRKWEEEEER